MTAFSILASEALMSRSRPPHPIGRETVLFQLLGQADTEEFRERARLIR
jgi:hypothetical protein